MLVLAGTNSLVGRSLLPRLRNDFQVCAFDRDQGSLQDGDFLEKLFADTRPDIFINTVQMGNLEECEYKKEDAYRINAFVPELLANFCAKYDTKLVHFSSSYIFDGKKDKPYTEGDTPSPISVYGDSKYLGEQKILQSGCKHLIVRVPDLIGNGAPFLKNIITQLKNLHAITVIRDQKINPTFADDLATAVINLLQRDAEGVFNFCNSGSVNIVDFIYDAANFYIKYSSTPLDFRVQEVDILENLSPVDWPLNNLLDGKRYQDFTGDKTGSWKDGLKSCMQKYYSSF